MSDRVTYIVSFPAGTDTGLLEKAIVATAFRAGLSIRVDDPYSYHAFQAPNVVPFPVAPRVTRRNPTDPTPPRAA